MSNRNRLIGTKFTGWTEAWFKNDSYLDKVIVANGEYWFVAEDVNGRVWLLDFEDFDDMTFFVNKWTGKDEE